MRVMDSLIECRLKQQIGKIHSDGQYKHEDSIQYRPGPGATITIGGKSLTNFCSNDYLGLSHYPEIVQATKQGLDKWGFGMASVRFI